MANENWYHRSKALLLTHKIYPDRLEDFLVKQTQAGRMACWIKSLDVLVSRIKLQASLVVPQLPGPCPLS